MKPPKPIDPITNEQRALAEKNIGLISNVIRRFKYSRYMPTEDAFQFGAIGLCEAARRFDPERGFKFSTYAVWWIRAFIVRYLMRHLHQIRIPEKKQSQGVRSPAQINNIIQDEDGNECSIFDKISDDPETEMHLAEKDLIEKALDEIQKLKPKQRRAAESFFLIGMTLDETGKRLGVCRERVRQINKKTLSEIREKLDIKIP